jgi:TolB protein
MTGFTGAVFLVDLIKKKRWRLTDENTYAQNPRWAPDGQTIYFRGQVGRQTGIYKIPFMGGKAERVTSAYGEFSL